VRELLECLGREARRRGRRDRKRREARELSRHVEDGDAQFAARLGERRAIVAQHAPQAHERLVDVAHLGLSGALVAADRTDQVRAQRRRRDRETVEMDPAEPVRDALERRAPGADHEGALSGAHELAERVDRGLHAAGPRQSVDDERLTADDARQDGLLLGIGVEQQRVRGRRTVVGIRRHRDGTRLLHHAQVVDLSRERSENRMVDALQVAHHVAGDVGERRHDEARLDGEAVDVARQLAQAVDDRLGLEEAAVIRERGERRAVELHPELIAHRPHELGVDTEVAAQLEFEVGVVATQTERAQQDRCGEPLAAEGP
jgi:hypothetical protein